MTHTRVRSLGGLALVSMFLVTGCGSVPALNPGVAVRVGDDTVSRQQVQDTADDYCAATLTRNAGQVPNHYNNGLSASAYALRAAADRFMDDHDVSVDDSYDQAIGEAEAQLADLSEAQRDAVIQIGGASVYASAAEISVGRDLLGGSPSDEDAQAAGQKEFVSWLDDQDVRIDPRYGVSVDDGVITGTDTSLSFALGSTATKADAAEPDATYAASLPASQRCG